MEENRREGEKRGGEMGKNNGKREKSLDLEHLSISGV